MKATSSRPSPGIRRPRVLAVGLAALVAAGGLGWYLGDRPSTRPDATSAGAASVGTVWCAAHLKDAGVDPGRKLTLLSGGRDGVSAEIASAGFTVMLCLADGHGLGVVDGLDPTPGGPVAPAPSAVVLDAAGAAGAASGSGGGMGYATGFTGDDVRGITVTAHGRTIRAVVQNHRWLAWWPVDHLASGYHGQDATVAATLANGTTHTTPLSRLPTLTG